MNVSLAAFIATVLFSGLLAGNIWYFFVRPSRPWSARFGLVLQIIGLYTFVFGIVSKMEMLPKSLIEDMISPDLFVFISGNLRAVAILFLSLSMSLDPEKTAGGASQLLELLLPLAFAPLVLLTAAFHLLVIVPFTYVAYVVASVPLAAIERASNEIALLSGDTEVRIKTLFTSNVVAFKNLAVAFPSLALRVALEIAASRRKAPEPVAIPTDHHEGWTSRHSRLTRVLLRVCQGVLAMIVFTAVVTTAVLPWDEPSYQIGQPIGAAIVTALLVWLLLVFIVKAERMRTRLAATSPWRIGRRARALGMAAATVLAFVWLYAAIDAGVERSLTECEGDDARACAAACNRDVAWACARAGRLYEDGKNGLPKNAARAAELYRTSCDLGSAIGCHNLAVMYAAGEGGLAVDATRAVALYTKACESGHGPACTRLGKLYADARDGVEADLQRAFGAYEKACERDEPEGCALLARMYDVGKGRVARDPAKAATLYQKACTAGSGMACNNLGVMHAQDDGMPGRDATRASDLFRKSCEAGEAAGCGNLGQVYLKGDGVAADLPRGLDLMQKACDLGDAEVCRTLARGYGSGGGGVARDVPRAARLHRKACDAGAPSSCAELGQLYERGVSGVPRDVEQALAMYRKGCEARVAAGCEGVKRPTQ